MFSYTEVSPNMGAVEIKYTHIKCLLELISVYTTRYCLQLYNQKLLIYTCGSCGAGHTWVSFTVGVRSHCYTQDASSLSVTITSNFNGGRV